MRFPCTGAQAGTALLFGLLIILLPLSLRADDAVPKDVTFTRDVAPILIGHCVQCHRPGENSPMTLMSYEEARPWAKSIKSAVQKKEMPPWKADAPHGKFANDISLNEQEIATLVSWVDQGAPQGDAAEMPAMPKFTQGWKLGEPDYLIELDEIDVPSEGTDYFPNVEVKLDIPGDRWVRAVEVRPGNTEVLHHVVGFVGAFGMMSGKTESGADPSIKPEQVKPGGGGAGGLLNFDVPVVWAAGSPPTLYPDGMGRLLRKGSMMTVNMHYHLNGKAAKDKTRIGLYFGEGEMKKVINTAFAGSVTFKIPPGAANHEISAAYLFDQDSHIVSYFPHMHLRGKSMVYTATYPDGRKEELLNVPRYDFNWQWFYYPAQLVAVPKGTRVDVVAHFDNSEKNTNNPDPKRLVGFGEESTDEMMFGVIEYIVDEGLRPKPVNVREKIARVLASAPPDSGYEIEISMGVMKMTTGLVLEKAKADGVWYFPLGPQLITMSVSNVVWEDNRFRFNMETPTAGGVIIASGEVREDGSIKGDFDLSAIQAPGPSQFQMKGFEGKRVPAGELAAAGGGQ